MPRSSTRWRPGSTIWPRRIKILRRPAEQQRAVEREIDWLDHALNPDNVEQQARLKAAGARWQAILDAPEDRRLARIEADLAALQTQMNAEQSAQQTILETLTRIEQALVESEPRNAEQTARKSTLQARLLALREHWQAILDALEDRRLARSGGRDCGSEESVGGRTSAASATADDA